ncbi:MAG: autotransporter domain-containing protein, partial [Burkholderiales bacterium]
IDGSILNHGSLEGGRYGLWLYWDLAKVGGQIKNTGVITGGRDGIYMYNGAVVEEGLVNTGRIEGADYSGVFVYHGSQVNGGITNSGLVQGGEHGVFVSDAVVTGGIVNTGVFNGIAGSGLSVYDASSVAGGVTNSGTIRGASSGISVTSNSAISGGITNTGSILTDGAAGIDVGSTGAIDRIDNWGTIAGPTYALQSAGNVGQVNIFGQSAILSGDVLASTADMTLRSGAVFSNSGAYDLRSFTVETGSRLNFGQGLRAAGSSLTQDGVRVTHGFSNAGWVSVASGVRPTITGDYTQSASGMFSLGLTDATTYGRLAVTGNATLANGTGLDVVVGTSAVVADGSLIPGVITAGDTLTVTPGSLKVTDNSIFYDFTPSTARNAKELDLVATADPSGIVKVGGTGILAGPAATLQTLFNSGTATAMQPVFQRLALLNPTQFEGALTQMLPSLQGAGAQAGMSALHNMGRIVQARVEGSKGLSSGDAIQRDDYLWVRPFATRGDQSDRGGASGFESLSRGIVIGVDGVTGDRWRTGLALAYAKSDITAQSAIAPSRMDVDSYQAIGYGTYTLDEITELNYQVDIGRHTASSQRSLGFMGTSAAGRFDALAVHASLGIGRLYKVSEHANLTPSARLDVTRMRTDGYTESGAGPLDLTLGAQTYREMILSADAKLVHQIEPGLRLAANVAAGYDFQNSPVNSTAAFVGGGPVFTTQGMETSPWIYRAGLGLIKENSAGVEYSLRYDFEGRPSGYRNQTLSARARWLF